MRVPKVILGRLDSDVRTPLRQTDRQTGQRWQRKKERPPIALRWSWLLLEKRLPVYLGSCNSKQQQQQQLLGRERGCVAAATAVVLWVAAAGSAWKEKGRLLRRLKESKRNYYFTSFSFSLSLI